MPEFGTEFEYTTLHLPTGKSFTTRAEFLSRLNYLECLAKWNFQGADTWKYAPAEGEYALFAQAKDPSNVERREF